MAPAKSTKATEATAPAEKADTAMTDAPPDVRRGSFDENSPRALAFEKQRVRVLPGSSATAASFEFQEEDHTLGNALRYIIMKNPEVEFCGYSIPHPSEELMNIRIQTYEGTTATEALEKGLNDLMDLCDVVSDKFMTAAEQFASKNQS
ncbi:DNA-directed RNA polymerase [Amylocarpus encephaloides]|uniref:DNA-directed RNA polymerases I and III subunit RPAC2 n=1 Tax=Amylocarpus encephaloides TaxID=45428 RepID=A0A9P7YKT4_9HELO|nr:DNA-directed RNA polymerase [Amylocarpus encephaloides]